MLPRSTRASCITLNAIHQVRGPSHNYCLSPACQSVKNCRSVTISSAQVALLPCKLPGTSSYRCSMSRQRAGWSLVMPSKLGEKLQTSPGHLSVFPLSPSHRACTSTPMVAVAMIGELVAATAQAATSSNTPSHIPALATVTQMAVTAVAVVYGCYLSPYGDYIMGRDREGEKLEPLVIDGVDVTEYIIFREPEVQRAIDFAREAHIGQVRKTGEPYVTHCIHTARILAALVPAKAGSRAVQTVVAGVLHDVVDDTSRTLTDIRNVFGEEIANLTDGVSRLSRINQLLRRHRRTTAEQNSTDNGLSPAEVDSLRVMLLGMVNDPRVVLIKLADRLHNMRTVYALAPKKASAVAQETLAVWCSLASRLGVWAVKAELEDLCFAVLQPQTYRQLRAELAAMWSPEKDWRSSRRAANRSRRRTLLIDDDADEERQMDPEDEAEISMEDLLGAVVPFEMLLDRNRRSSGLATSTSTSQEGTRPKTKVVRDAEVALAALAACEDALDKELLITTPYVPGMEVTLSGRLKSLYSAHCKMRRKGVGLDKVYDARALRLVVGDRSGELHVAAIEGCYSLLHVVHSLWSPIGGELDDYIVNPKGSGYQSLHTAVVGPDGAPLEIQIRTQGMHEYAEYGHAAHWLYKENDAIDFSMGALIGPIPPPPPPIKTADEMLHTGVGQDDDEVSSSTSSGGESTVKTSPATVAVGLWAPALHPPVPSLKPGHPALRVEDGRLLAGVVIQVDDNGRSLLVGVSFALHAMEAVAAGRSGNQRRRWETYARLFRKISDQWWFAPGHGDWSTCLERYTLCRDGIYHKEDQFGRALPTFIQLLELGEEEKSEYGEVMELVLSGHEVDFADEEPAIGSFRPDSVARTSETPVTVSRLNNKVRLLRSMLQWEQEVRHEAAPDGSITTIDANHPDSATLTEVLVIRWPDGEIVRMPTGSTAGDAAEMLGVDGKLVLVNNRIAHPSAKLRDGDLVEIRNNS